MSSSRASECTQTVAFWKLLLCTLSQRAVNPILLGTSWQWTPWDGKNIFVACFIWFRPWKAQRACDFALRDACLHHWFLLGCDWKQSLKALVSIYSSFCTALHQHTDGYCATLRNADCLLHVCVRLNLPRIDSYGLVLVSGSSQG